MIKSRFETENRLQTIETQIDKIIADKIKSQRSFEKEKNRQNQEKKNQQLAHAKIITQGLFH